MTWSSISDFVAMGGYATFVWGSYAVTTACLAFEIYLLVRRRKRLRANPP